MSERALAAELDRALDGGEAGAEARELAMLLAAVAAPAAFEVQPAEVEAALARTPRPRARSRGRRRVRIAAAAFAAAAIAAVVSLALLPGGESVQAHAARAVQATFRIDLRVRPLRPRLFPASEITGYVDARSGREHLYVYSNVLGEVAETVVQSNGSVERWLARTNTTLVARSCDALPGGCGETFDPFGLYVRALEDTHAGVRRAARGYELRLASGRVEQVVLVDPRRYLPRTFEWLEGGRAVAVMSVAALERESVPPPSDEWTMSAHPGARIIQLTASGRRVHVLSVHAARPTPAIRWLGPSYHGVRARVEAVRLTGGRATRVSYGPLVVWSYGAILPPEVLQARNLAVKVFTLANGALVHAYYGPGTVHVAAVSYGITNAAVVSRGGNVDVVEAVQELTRPGSP